MLIAAGIKAKVDFTVVGPCRLHLRGIRCSFCSSDILYLPWYRSASKFNDELETGKYSLSPTIPPLTKQNTRLALGLGTKHDIHHSGFFGRRKYSQLSLRYGRVDPISTSQIHHTDYQVRSYMIFNPKPKPSSSQCPQTPAHGEMEGVSLCSTIPVPARSSRGTCLYRSPPSGSYQRREGLRHL